MKTSRVCATGSTLILALLVVSTLAYPQVSPSAYVNFESAQTNPIRILADGTRLFAFTQAQLAAKVLAGDILSVMGVPPGSGTRMGIDRNLDGILDGN